MAHPLLIKSIVRPLLRVHLPPPAASRACSSPSTDASCPTVVPHDARVADMLSDCMSVHSEFITPEEEESLLKELHPILRKIRYEPSHWDNAIAGYRETEKRVWSPENERVIRRIRESVFCEGQNPLPLVHVLDLTTDGQVKPHIDSVRFCGDVIAGLSLLSDSVFRLVHQNDSTLVSDFLLRRRSLYVMKGKARHEFTHAILGPSDSQMDGILVPRGRRISVLFRCEPADQESDKAPDQTVQE